MTTPDVLRALNFIEEIIEEDLRTGRHDTVVTRFPPEPNGYLHIGHAKSICLNFGVASEYGGHCNLRFDDTNPAKEDIEYANAIIADVKWLGFSWGESVFHAADYFDQLYEWAEFLINEGKAFVDSSTADDIRTMRGTLTEVGKNSPDRDRPVEENPDLFRRMRAGEFPERPQVLRPHNVVRPAAGRGVFELTVGGERLLVVNLLGKTATYPPLEARDALAVFDELTIATGTTVFIDFHAEMTLEKRTFAHAVDGRAAAVIGTHTHEPSLRLERFPGGTFFVADAGMVGPSGGVVGMAPDWYIRQMRGKMQPGFTLAAGPIQVGAIVLDLGARKTIERFLPELSASSVR